MVNYPNSFDDDTTLPAVNDNIQEIGGSAINALRDATFNIEQNIGLGAAGTTGSIANRIGISLDPSGAIKPSAIASLGLVSLPITNNQISNSAQIPESKLKLDHRTQDLFNYIQSLSQDVNVSLGWISTTGSKLDPHLFGIIYRHTLSDIDINADPNLFLKNKFGILRDNSNAYLFANDINNELLNHQFADGSQSNNIANITTLDGSIYPSNYAHTSSGVFLNTSRFSTIPQTASDLQQFAEFVDNSGIFLYGTRVQNLYSNGISRSSRSSNLNIDGYGQTVIPTTPVIAHLLNTGINSSPFDDINYGDDIIEFKPLASDISSNSFDEKFALVKIGDILRINYGTTEVQFIVNETKYIQSNGIKRYLVRIAGKNLFYAPNAIARIDRSLVNNTKFGALSISAVNNSFSAMPSLIVGNPKAASVLGIGFNPDQLDSSHYLLYLAIYPTGSPQDGYNILPGIDVTGNQGLTPGVYTLDSIVNATNNAFRQTGYNYRFVAYEYQGEFGIMLADSFNNISFSIINGIINTFGNFDVAGTSSIFINNVIDISNNDIDPLGFGVLGSNVASPLLQSSYSSTESALKPTKIFIPLKRNNYYINGTERDKLSLEVNQTLDVYGDGYWVATVQNQNIFPSPVGRVQTTYRVPLNLSTSKLAVGKTITVQSAGQGAIVNFGRFIIESVTFTVCNPNPYTDIVVYDAVHGTGLSPSPVLNIGSAVNIYFGFDSVSFNRESATDFNNVVLFKRHFEAYVDQNGKTFTHERGRINISGSNFIVNGITTLYTSSELGKLDIVKISPKLRGYQFGPTTKITLQMTDYDSITGLYDGYLASYDGTSFANLGPLTSGKKGQVSRFYDETNLDYIDILFDISASVNSFTLQIIDFQLFPTLSLDNELMLIGTCQLNDVTNTIKMLKDERQFGNTGEKDLTTSALNFISLPNKLLHSNGVIRGFDLTINQTSGQKIFLNGGICLVNGKFIQINNKTVTIPLLQELNSTLYNINWALCVNDGGEYQPIPLLDFDSALGTPNAPNRLFTGFNPLNGLSYTLDASTFSNILNVRKDLTILYVVSSTMNPAVGLTPPSLTLNVFDARKYINDGDSNLPLKLTSANTQGNFKNVASIFNWLKYNSTYNNNAFVGGANVNNGSVNIPLTLNFINTVTINGDNNALLTFNKPIVLGSNLIFKNLNITFNGGLSIISGASNLIFDNCTITINNNISVPPVNNIIFDFINGNDIKFTDCDLTIQYVSLINLGSAMRFTNVTGFEFINNSLSVSFDIVPGIIMPGNIFEFHNSSNILVQNSQFTGNFNKFVEIDKTNNIELIDINVTSTYNPNAGESPDIYNGTLYTTSDLINNGQGYIHANVATTLDNIKIDNVVFNYSPVIINNDRYSFINFELSTNLSILSNLQITNCKFNHTNLNGATDDIRPAISIINTSPLTILNSQQPMLLNVNINNNTCNKNQSIILTSKTIGGIMYYPGLMPQGCTISKNICGTIGYWVASGSRFINISPNNNKLTDKNIGLTIDSNVCHYITNSDHTGKYFQVSKVIATNSTNMCQYPSGYVLINNNKANWIHTGISYENDSSLNILNNSLTAYDYTYLNQYNDVVDDLLYKRYYAIVVNSNVHTNSPVQNPSESNNSSCIISGNNTNTGYWLQVTLNSFIYKYAAGYVFSQTSCNIHNNIFKGIDDTSIITSGGSTPAIVVGGTNHLINSNQIYRQGLPIASYISFGSDDSIANIPSWNGSTSSAIISNNFFDSPFINNATSVDTTVIVPANAQWTVEKNKNQTVYTTVPMTCSQMFLYGGLGFENFGNNNLYITSAPSAGFGYKSMVVRIHDADSISPRFYGWQESLDKFLPNGVRVLLLKMGVKSFGSLVETPTNPNNGFDSNIYLFLNRYNNINTYVTDMDSVFSTTPGSDVDTNILNDTGSEFVTHPAHSATITGGQINSTPNAQYMILDTTTAGIGSTDISGQFITGLGSPISVSLDIRFKRQNTCDLYFSPLLVKYRW